MKSTMCLLYRSILLFGSMIFAIKARSQNTATADNQNQAVFTLNAGSNLTLHASSTNAKSFQWYKNGSKMVGDSSENLIVSTEGLYTVTSFSTEGQPSELSERVQIIMKPVPDVIAKSDRADLTINIAASKADLNVGDIQKYTLIASNNHPADGTQVEVDYLIPENFNYLFSNTPDGTVNYNEFTKTLTWNIDKLSKDNPLKLDVNLKAVKAGPAESMVAIKAPGANSYTATYADVTQTRLNPVTFPNIFTPNGDGINDSFVISGLDNYSDNVIAIFTRGGNVVYTKNHYQNDWTGQSLAQGTYYYILKIKKPTGEWEQYKGSVTLLRSPF